MAIPLSTLGQFRIGTTEYAAGRARTIGQWLMVRKQYGDNSSAYSYAVFTTKADYLAARQNPGLAAWVDEPFSNIDYTLLLLPMATPLPASTATGGAVAAQPEGAAVTAGISTEAAQDKQIALLEQLLTQPATASTDRATETTLQAIAAQLQARLHMNIDGGQVNIGNWPATFGAHVDNWPQTFWQDTQPVSLASVPLATGAATSAAQLAQQVSLNDINTKLGGTLTVTYSGTQQVAGTITLANPTETGLAKNATLTDGTQKTQVVNWPATQPVSGPLTDAQLRAAPVPVSGFPTSYPVTGTFWQATQPVSALALPLPTGASTEATLALIKAKTDNLDVLLSTRTKPGDTQKVDGSGATQPVSAAALPLPAGASTAALQTAGNTSAASIDGKLTGVSTAALQTSGNTLLQTIATNTTTGPKAAGGLASRVVVANAASATPTVIKAGAGQLYHLGIGNTSTGVIYVSLFNKATVPVSGDIPVEIHPIPPGQYISIDYPMGTQYSTGISLTITSNLTLLGVLTGLLAANQVVVNVAYA